MKTKPNSEPSFDWYWEKKFNTPGSDLYFDRRHWWNDKNERVACLADSLKADVTLTLTSHSFLQRLTIREVLRVQERLNSPDFEIPSDTLACYELLRRHPRHGELYQEAVPRKADKMLDFLRECGMRAWRSLTPVERGIFRLLLQDHKPIIGHDPRPIVTNLLAEESSELLLALLVRTSGAFRKGRKANKPAGLVGSPFLHPTATDRKMYRRGQNAKWGELAGKYAESGHLLLAISPGRGTWQELSKEIETHFERWRKGTPASSGRSRGDDWLALIERFEASEDERIKRRQSKKVNRGARHALRKVLRKMSI